MPRNVLTEARNAEAAELFKLYDADKSGKVNVNELSKLVRSMGYAPTDKELAAIIADYDKNGDGKLNFDEFVKLLETEELASPPSDAELRAAFKVFDKNGSGNISRDELKSAMTNHGEKMSEAEVDAMLKQFDTDGDGKISYAEFIGKGKPAAARAAMAVPPKTKSDVDWEAIAKKLPIDKASAEEKQQRKELFRAFDPNGNGYLSLAEVHKGFRDVLVMDEIFDIKPVMMRAFQAAKGVGNQKGRPTKHGADYVEFCEFRLLLLYIRQYFELWKMFDELDTADDRRVDFAEFQAAIGKIEAWGLKIDDAEAEFKSIDKNGGGQVLFIEFTEWALAKKLDLEDDDNVNESL